MGSSCTKSESVTLEHASHKGAAEVTTNNNNEVKSDVKDMVVSSGNLGSLQSAPLSIPFI